MAARTTQEIFEIMRQKAIADATAIGDVDAVEMYEENDSSFAFWRSFFFTVAFITHTCEVIFETFVQTVLDIIDRLKPHTRNWYRNKILDFCYGIPLVTDSDKFNTTGFTPQQIEFSKIVKYCAINETTVNQLRVLQVKVAGRNGQGIPIALTAPQELALITYIEEIKDAGVVVLVYNQAADVIKASLNVYYNPMLLDSLGNRLDGAGGKPIEEAALAYPFNLGFNGEFIASRFIDAVQSAYGVSRNRADLVLLQKKTGNNQYINVNSSFVPDAGYAVFENNGLIINYIADVVG